MKHLLWLFLAAFAPATMFGQYAITTSGLPVATVNQPYQGVVQTNSTAPATVCTVSSGSLPAGLAVQVSGFGCVISGTPIAAGVGNVGISVSNNQGQTTAPRVFSLTVFGIATTSLPAAAAGSSYAFQLQAVGDGPFEWSLAGGSLPAGVSLSSNGLLSGTPPAAGLFSFTVRAIDLSLGGATLRNLSLTVNSPGNPGSGFQIVSSSLPNAGLNQAYTATVQTSGAAGNLSSLNGCQILQGSLPPGIFIGPVGTSCILSGAATGSGTFSFQLQATDSQNRTTPAVAFSLTVGTGSGSGGISITTGTVPNGSTGTQYLPNGSIFTFAATGGSGVYTWQLENGALPSGLTLNSTGTLTGIPRQAGTFNFTIRVTSGGLLTSFQQTATRSFTIAIASGALIIVETSLPPATIGQAFSFALHASGGTAPYRWRIGQTDLQGFAIDFTSGVLTGSATAPGTFSLPITVTDAAGGQSSFAFSLVSSAAFTVTTFTLPDVSLSIGYSQSLQAVGGQTPYTWTISSGSLPPGLTMTQTGNISGVPTINGLYTFTAMATDAAGRTASRILSIQVGAPSPVVILTGNLPDGAIGSVYSQVLTASGGQSPYTWTVAAGALPGGVALSSVGALQGTPTQGGSFSFSAQARDAVGNTTAKGFTLNIATTRLTFSPNQLNFAYAVGGGQPFAQRIAISASSAVSFNVSTGTSWITFTPSAGTTPSVLSISANPAGLAVGVYTGSVTVTPTSISESPQVIPVILTVSATSGLFVSPTALTFSYQLGSVVPDSQPLFISGSGATLGFSAFSGASWLGVSPANGVTPTTLNVAVNPAGLAAGTYTGSVNLVGGGGSRQIPVTLVVSPPVAPLITLTPGSLAFTYQLGGALPTTQFVTLRSSSLLSFSAVSDMPWLTVTTNSGTPPASLMISVNPQGLAPAVYNGNIVITTTSGFGNTTHMVPVVFTVSSTGFPVIAAVVNAASYASGAIAPGEIVTITGSLLGPSTPAQLTLDQAGRVATTVGGVQVLFNGFAAPLTYVSATQINAVVPYEIAAQPNVLIAVRYQGVTSVAFPTTSTGSAPGIFTLNASGTGPGAILNQDGTVNSPTQAAARGTIVTIYVTGEGQTIPGGVTGKVTTTSPTGPLTPQPILPVGVIIGGQPAPVTFYGEAPGLVSGVMQVNVRIPLTAASGEQSLEVLVGSNRTQAGVTVSVE